MSVTVDLRLGDCLEVMRDMPDGCVDAVITDPPYGLNFRGADWDAEIPDWIDEARRVAGVVAFTTCPTTQWDYPRPDWVCCWYREASNARNWSGGFSHWSPVLVYGKTKFAVDSIKLHAIQHAQQHDFPHPSPKPIALMRWLVENACGEGATVLDPFMGSGTTGVACVQTGRNFIGIEINPEYFAIAERRIADAQRNYQPQLALA